MKRLGVIFSALLVVIFLVLAFLIFFPAPSPTAPKFISVQVQPTGPYTYMDYDWGGAVPVRDGKVWFWAESSRTNVFVRQFLYDLDRRRVTGELLNAGPIFANRDQTKLLCEGYGPVASLKW